VKLKAAGDKGSCCWYKGIKHCGRGSMCARVACVREGHSHVPALQKICIFLYWLFQRKKRVAGWILPKKLKSQNAFMPALRRQRGGLEPSGPSSEATSSGSETVRTARAGEINFLNSFFFRVSTNKQKKPHILKKSVLAPYEPFPPPPTLPSPPSSASHPIHNARSVEFSPQHHET
jgi:hypothetical protein